MVATMGMELFERTLLVVHGARPASAQDWDRYLADFVAPGVSAVLIVVDSSYPGPTALQRAQASDAANRAAVFRPIAVVTGSRMHRGIVTVVSWMQRNNLAAFSPRELPAAMGFAGIKPERRGVALSRVHELARRVESRWIVETLTL